MDRLPKQGLLGFGDFVLDISSRELRKRGVKVRVRPQPLRVLLLLLERPGEVVARDEFRHRLWPSGVFTDFDHALNRSISMLRDVLSDSAGHPRYIETVPLGGYRFVATVKRKEAGDGSRANVRIAVLPVANVSSDPRLESLADALTESLTDVLTRALSPRASVVALACAGQFKDAKAQLPVVAEALRVEFVITGVLRQRDGGLRLRLELIDIRTQTALWMRCMECPESGDFQDQDTVTGITSAIAQAALRRPGEGPRKVGA
jgi:DNA-binding winged helix-turn-helix (wHTH) protein